MQEGNSFSERWESRMRRSFEAATNEFISRRASSLAVFAGGFSIWLNTIYEYIRLLLALEQPNEMAHYLVPLLEDLIRVQRKNTKRFYIWCVFLLSVGIIGTVLLFYFRAGNELLRVGPIVFTTAMNGFQVMYMSPSHERLSGFQHAKMLLERQKISPEQTAEIEKIVLDALRDILKKTVK